MKTILILEDNDERIAAFQKVAPLLGDGFELKIWRDAPSMMAECEPFFRTTALISLDHDLNPMPGATIDRVRGGCRAVSRRLHAGVPGADSFVERGPGLFDAQ